MSNKAIDVEKTSAIASWNGFVYQGKVCLYTIVRMLVENRSCSDYCFRLEHLDDFAIFDESGNKPWAVSVHQVKATAETSYNYYKSALEQASNIESDYFTQGTRRYFHVSSELNDFTTYTDGPKDVVFYRYHDDKKFASLDSIEAHIKTMIEQYLESKHLVFSDDLISYKYNVLLSFLDSKVTYLHAKNQESKDTQYQVTDKNPISFNVIDDCLKSEFPSNERQNLENSRRDLISEIDKVVNNDEFKNSDVSLDDLSVCKQKIACLNNDQLKQLCVSFSPCDNYVGIKSYPNLNDARAYVKILSLLNRLITRNALPHYRSVGGESFLPTSFQLGTDIGSNQMLGELKQNIESGDSHNLFVFLFYEYENFIVNSKDQADDREFTINRKSTHKSEINDEEYNNYVSGGLNSNGPQQRKDNITFPKKTRFVSVKTAKEELG